MHKIAFFCEETYIVELFDFFLQKVSSYEEIIKVMPEILIIDEKNYNKKNIIKISESFQIKVILILDDKKNFVKYDDSEPDYLILKTDYEITLRSILKNIILEIENKEKYVRETKSAFIANISHELRTPLNGIIGFSDILLQNKYDDETMEFLKIIHSSGEILLNLVEDLLEISDYEENRIRVEKNEFNFYDFIGFIELYYKEKCREKNIDFVIEINENIPKIIISDSLKIKQILNKLLCNSLKFTDKGQIKLICYIDNNNLVFEVSDTGIGISEKKLNRIFEKFDQGEYYITKKYRGSGLGLSIVKSIIDSLGGNIEINSVHGEGTTVKLTIKIDFVKEEKIINEKNKQEKFTILIAEDYEVNQKLLRMILENKSFEVLIAINGFEVLEKYEQCDLIIMDIQMPGLNGFDATKLIREKNTVIPIIGVSAYALAEFKEKAIGIGMNDFITKPYKSDVLFEIIDKFLKK